MHGVVALVKQTGAALEIIFFLTFLTDTWIWYESHWIRTEGNLVPKRRFWNARSVPVEIFLPPFHICGRLCVILKMTGVWFRQA